MELEKHLGEPYYGTFILPLSDYEEASPGSSDVGDVSWVTPTAQINTATWAAETPGHSWQIVAQGKGSIAHKAQLFAAKVMAGAVIDLLNEPETIEKAKKELDYRRGHKSFTSPIPKGVRPSTLK
jgi:aminobenzoyl-glutamate utilization protein B